MARAIETFCLMPVLIFGAEHIAEVVHLQRREHLSMRCAQRRLVMP